MTAKPKDKLIDTIGQFTTIPNTVIRLWPILGMDAFALFVCLRYHSDDNGVSFPAYSTITKETGLTRNKIARGIRVLEIHKLLTRQKRFSGSTIYTLTMPSISPDAVLMDIASSPAAGLQLSRSRTTVVPNRDTNQTHLTRSIQQDPQKEYMSSRGKKAVSTTIPSLVQSRAELLFCEVTGLFVLPANSRRQSDIDIIESSIRARGIDTTRERMQAAWAWWKTGKGKNGRAWGRTNTAWLDKVMTDEPLPAHVIPPDDNKPDAGGGFYG